MRKFLENASSVYQINLTEDRHLNNAFKAYQTSIQSELLKGEETRLLFPEILKLKETKRHDESENLQETPKKVFDDDDSSDEELMLQQMSGQKSNWFMEVPGEARSNFPKRLCEFATEELARNYKSGPINPMICGEHFVKFGEMLDVELPVLDLLELDVIF